MAFTSFLFLFLRKPQLRHRSLYIFSLYCVNAQNLHRSISQDVLRSLDVVHIDHPLPNVLDLETVMEELFNIPAVHYVEHSRHIGAACLSWPFAILKAFRSGFHVICVVGLDVHCKIIGLKLHVAKVGELDRLSMEGKRSQCKYMYVFQPRDIFASNL